MLDHKVGYLQVVEDCHLVGIITVCDFPSSQPSYLKTTLRLKRNR